MRLVFGHARPRKGTMAKGPPPPWMIPELEKHGRRTPPKEPQRPELPLEEPPIAPRLPDKQKREGPQRGIVIIDPS